MTDEVSAPAQPFFVPPPTPPPPQIQNSGRLCDQRGVFHYRPDKKGCDYLRAIGRQVRCAEAIGMSPAETHGIVITSGRWPKWPYILPLFLHKSGKWSHSYQLQSETSRQFAGMFSLGGLEGVREYVRLGHQLFSKRIPYLSTSIPTSAKNLPKNVD